MRKSKFLPLALVVCCLFGCGAAPVETIPTEETTLPTAPPLPVFDRHVPFLFVDEDGLLHPDAPFTSDALRAALTALTADTALLPELPAGEDALTPEQLRQILEPLFPDVSYPQIQNELTREKAAFILETLLGRTNESVSPEANAFPDVPSTDPTYVQMMEAACPHHEGQTPWTDTDLTTGLEPGWQLCRGRLRMLDDQGFMIRDTVIDDTFTINAQGWFTSGSEELDGYVREKLAQFQQEAPEADRMELLKMCNDYVRDSFKYLRRNPYYAGFTGWEIQDAINMFQSGLGNCYSYAGMFWAFAKNLGFQAIPISGNIGSRPHGWVMIKTENGWFYCDPELEMSIREEKRYELDLFMQPRGQAMGIEYIEPW